MAHDGQDALAWANEIEEQLERQRQSMWAASDSLKITRRLALAALRLAVLLGGVSPVTEHARGAPAFAALGKWLGLRIDGATSAALDEAVAALREAGEVSE